MSSSPYSRDLHHILAALHTPADAQESPLPDEEPVNTIYVYPTEQGGLLLSPTRIEGDEDDDALPPPVVESELPSPRQGVPPFLSFVVLLLCFVVLDMANSQLLALMTPTATITIVPSVHTLTLQSSTHLGKLLAPITLSESLTVPATGHGHQDATRATGSLTFYNGLFTPQVIPARTPFTGQHGITIALDHTVTIPAAHPPQEGEATGSATATQPGTSGNIPAGEITVTITNGVLVSNPAPFTGGQDARDFTIVTRADIGTATATLQARVSASMSAALQGQLLPGQALQRTPCAPAVTANHAVGDEAATVEVTVAEACTAIVYDPGALTTQATRLLSTQAARAFGTAYTRAGPISISVTQAITQHHTIVLFYTGRAAWVYQVNAARLQALIGGQPRLAALHLLAHLPGIAQVSISGLADDQVLPADPAHLHVLVVLMP
jgi:hypothetical protein